MNTTETSPLVADLQSRWHTLNDLDRAQAIQNIRQPGLSIRKLAAALNCSESLLRHILLAAQALPEDRVLARRGQISTNELERRSRATRTRRDARHREAVEFERTQAAVRACKTVCAWLAAEELSGAYGEQIVDEARLQLARAEESDHLPRGAAPLDLPTAEIIRNCRPPEPETEEFAFVARYACWLALWAYYAFPDRRVRDAALELALTQQFKR